jgi:hypothetical protein
MKYISIDIETTGLSLDDEIIEIGAIYREETFRMVFQLERYPVTPYTALMHTSLWKELKDLKAVYEAPGVRRAPTNFNGETIITYYSKSYKHFNELFYRWLEKIGFKYDKSGCIHINVAGKNFSGFDKQFLLRKLKNHDGKFHAGMRSFYFRHRVLDPSILFHDRHQDATLPNTQTCCDRAGITIKDEHTSLGDALTVQRLLEYMDVYSD